MNFSVIATALKTGCAFGLLALLAACSSGPEKRSPAELGPDPALLGIKQAWTVKIPPVEFPLDIKVNGSTVEMASSDGSLLALNAVTGAEIWRTNIKAQIAAGPGSDGRTSAVITRDNELVALEAGQEIWRQKLNAQSFTAPLVAGARVFVVTADRTVSAFDGKSGRKLWSQQRPADSLVLRQPGVLLAVGDTLVVGLSGRLVGLNPGNGVIRWEAAIASPRGANEIERLVDLVSHVGRVGTVVCARAYQAAVGCVDAGRGSLLWTKTASGATGVDADNQLVFGAEGDGKVLALRAASGDTAWESDKLKYRKLLAPVVVGRSVAVADESGWVHLLSREDGALLKRLSTDGSSPAAAPILAAGTLIVVTRKGAVFGFRPE